MFWWICGAAGAVLLIVVAVRLRRVGLVLLTCAVAATVGAAFLVAYQALGLIMR